MPRRADAPRPAPARAQDLVRDTSSATGPTILVCLLFLLMILPTNLDYAALVDQNTNTTVSKSDQSLTNEIALITLLVGSFFYISRRQGLWLRVIAALNPFYLLFIALAALSIMWSLDPAVTVRRVFRLLVILLCCTAFTLNGWRANRFQIVMRTLLGALLVGSVLFAVAIPHYGVQQFSDYAAAMKGGFVDPGVGLAPDIKPVLRGLTYGKNQMGQLASLGVLFWIHAWLGKETKTIWVMLCGGAAAICLYWAHSSTSILAAVFSLPVMLMLRHWPKWLRRYMRYILPIFVLVILGYSLVVLKLVPQLDFLLTPITALTGKDLTFSNRTAIWQIINAHIAEHPLLGTGYSAYWVDEPGSPSQIFVKRLFFWPGQSHNGYLEVINDLGIVGGVCLLGFLFSYLRQSIKIMEFDRHQGSLYVVLLFHQFWSSLSESHWLSAGSVSFTVISFAACTSARTLLQHRFELNKAQPLANQPARLHGTA